LLDTGVIIAGITQPWGAAKAVLILAAERDRYTVVLTETVRAELDAFMARQAERLPTEAHRRLTTDFRGWLARVHRERWPHPTAEALGAAIERVLPALRHLNDLPGIVAAMQARPDWALSSNDDHWNAEVARRTGLRIATPNAFLRALTPQPGDQL
jgi:hypothetical protein